MVLGVPHFELGHSPKVDELVLTARPVITVFLPMDGSGQASQARLWVNGKEVTMACQRNAAYVLYRPALELKEGTQNVRFAMGKFDESWTFRIKPLSPITSVILKAPQNPGEFDQVQVEARGPVHCQGWFVMDDQSEKFPLTEVSPGDYQGQFEIPAGYPRMRTVITASLQLGNTVIERKARPLGLLSSGFRIRVISPEPGSDIGGKFKLRGRTRPGCTVVILPRIGFQDGIEYTSDKQPLPVFKPQRIQTDAKGYFEYTFDRPATLPRMELMLMVHAEEADGQESDISTFEFPYTEPETKIMLPHP